MRVVTAVDQIVRKNDNEVTVFLAGGITDCPDWQRQMIDMLATENHPIEEHMVLVNPRRKNFPIHDPNAAREQIEWEFWALNHCDVFSMWFTGGSSVQPICMYELGRHLALCRGEDSVAIGMDPEYKRAQDVRIQTSLALYGTPDKDLTEVLTLDLANHACRIVDCCKIAAHRRKTFSPIWISEPTDLGRLTAAQYQMRLAKEIMNAKGDK